MSESNVKVIVGIGLALAVVVGMGLQQEADRKVEKRQVAVQSAQALKTKIKECKAKASYFKSCDEFGNFDKELDDRVKAGNIKAAEEREAKRLAEMPTGKHCTYSNYRSQSGYSISNLEFDIKETLLDRKSFEVITAAIYGVNNGKHLANMKYRAKNSLGGYVIKNASAYIDNKTCDVLSRW